jgi:hypothetical protein
MNITVWWWYFFKDVSTVTYPVLEASFKPSKLREFQNRKARHPLEYVGQ